MAKVEIPCELIAECLTEDLKILLDNTVCRELPMQWNKVSDLIDHLKLAQAFNLLLEYYGAPQVDVAEYLVEASKREPEPEYITHDIEDMMMREQVINDLILDFDETEEKSA